MFVSSAPPRQVFRRFRAAFAASGAPGAGRRGPRAGPGRRFAGRAVPGPVAGVRPECRVHGASPRARGRWCRRSPVRSGPRNGSVGVQAVLTDGARAETPRSPWNRGRNARIGGVSGHGRSRPPPGDCIFAEMCLRSRWTVKAKSRERRRGRGSAGRRPPDMKSGAGWIRGQSTRRRIIGVPTGARNTGTGAPTGDQSAGTNRTPKPPAVSQENVTTRFPVAVRKPACVPLPRGPRSSPAPPAPAPRSRRSPRSRAAPARRPPG